MQNLITDLAKSQEIIYLDNNATTKIAPEVLAEMLPCMEDSYGNPSSLHCLGRESFYRLELARQRVARLIGAEPEEIIFTSGGTESTNTALSNAILSKDRQRRIITTKVEHPATLNYTKHMEKNGYEIVYLPVDSEGQLEWAAFMEAVENDAMMVSMMWANNETGVIFPIEEVAAVCHERGIAFHSDAVQAAGKVTIDVKKLDIDMLSISGHKLHAPKGVGALYVRNGFPFSGYLLGGYQEAGRRAGTENLASIVGFGKACELATNNLESEKVSVGYLRNQLESGLKQVCPDICVHGGKATRLSNTSNLTFPQIAGETLLSRLDKQGICASGGSACSSGSSKPSHVLLAMGAQDLASNGSIRFSLGRYTSHKEIVKVLELMPGILKSK